MNYLSKTWVGVEFVMKKDLYGRAKKGLGKGIKWGHQDGETKHLLYWMEKTNEVVMDPRWGEREAPLRIQKKKRSSRLHREEKKVRWRAYLDGNLPVQIEVGQLR